MQGTYTAHHIVTVIPGFNNYLCELFKQVFGFGIVKYTVHSEI